MKAIHNFTEKPTIVPIVGNYKLKYNFESNSQPLAFLRVEGAGWEL